KNQKIKKFPSRTEIRYLTAFMQKSQRGERFSHYGLKPLSGKKHQLRVHMNALGMPICHDNFYPVLAPERAADDFSNPLQLLARAIGFRDPITGAAHFFESQRNLDLLALIHERQDVNHE
ncbi:hypothetical protein QP097_07850, partial [Oligella urethralis]|nr:hypothetical protein [Oligella urethralis]